MKVRKGQLEKQVEDWLSKFCLCGLKSYGDVTVRGKLEFCFSDNYIVPILVHIPVKQLTTPIPLKQATTPPIKYGTRSQQKAEKGSQKVSTP